MSKINTIRVILFYGLSDLEAGGQEPRDKK